MTKCTELRLAELAGVGQYFVLHTGEPDHRAGWRPASAVIGDAQELAGLIDVVAERLGTTERWIAASVFYQGWAARITSVYAGCAALGGAVPDLSAAALRYRFPASGPVDLLAAPLLAVDAVTGWRRLLQFHLDPLADAVRRQVRIGRHVLRGNLASALAGSLVVLAGTGHGALADLIIQGWAQPAELARCGQWRSTPAGPRYARATCCGYIQLPGGECGDCSLRWRGQA